MMTLTEKIKRSHSVSAKASALSKVAVSHLDAAVELSHVSAVHTPQAIMRHVRNAEASHWQQWREASLLCGKMYKADDTLSARPHIWESDDGTSRVMLGMLPNGVETSRDEDEALKIYAAYKVVADAEAAERITNMEVPF